jgi:hypothetical protein
MQLVERRELASVLTLSNRTYAWFSWMIPVLT